MSDTYLEDIGEILLEKETLKALYYAPVPILIVREDEKMSFMNQTISETTGLKPEATPTLGALIEHLQIFPASEPPLRASLFFKSTLSLESIKASVEDLDGRKVIWEFFNAPLGKDASGRRMILSIAQDITNTIAQQTQMEDVLDQLEKEVSVRTETLNRTIRTLENEILEKNRISDALTHSRERLKEISRRTLDILEADRQTVSKELHDSIGASLSAIKFSLEEKEARHVKRHGSATESLKQEVEYLATTIKETKRISAHLRPSTLDDLGLSATIDWYIRQFQRLYGDITIKYSSEIVEGDIHESVKINVYRIIQEALTNAARHSKAELVQLSLLFCDGDNSVSLAVEDNGCGFQLEKVLANKDPLGGYGLIAMRERCEILGGAFHIDSAIGRGTRINAILPLK